MAITKKKPAPRKKAGARRVVKKAVKKSVKKASPERAKKEVIEPPAPLGSEIYHEIHDRRLMVPQKVAALAFGISVEAFKKWRVKPREKKGRVTLYYLPDAIALRMRRADAGEQEYIRERTRQAKMNADLAELQLLERRAELIPADLILQTWEPIAGAIRTKVLGIKSKLKIAIPELNNDELKLIDNICRGILEDLSNGGVPRGTKANRHKVL
jgi:phage terminase Nu1 subunit (DNA packaging protein)